MKKTFLILGALLAMTPLSQAVTLDLNNIGQQLNGWSKKNIATYTIDHVVYRTYKPTLTHAPDGSLFVSMRLDAGCRSHSICYLQASVSPKGYITSIQAKVRLKGKTYDSGLIERPALQPKSAEGQEPVQNLTPWKGPLAQMTAELFSRLDNKILEADKDKKGHGRDIWGRLGGPDAARVNVTTVIRHNLNVLSGAIR